MSDEVRIFISYAREDQARVQQLFQRLVSAGYHPWLDREHIRPGQQWEPIIKRALKRSHFALVCLSTTSINKRGFLQKEIKQALEQAQEKLEDDVWLIPARLDDCDVPDALNHIQWVDLFEEDGFQQLLEAMTYQLQKESIRPPAVQATPKSAPPSVPVHSTPPPAPVRLPQAKPTPNPPLPLQSEPARLPVSEPPSLILNNAIVILGCVFIAALLGFWAWRYFTRELPPVEPQPQPTETVKSSDTPVVSEEVLRYSLESDGKNGFRFRFSSSGSGYLYVVAPMDRAGKEQWVYLTNNPAKEMLVPSNQLIPNGELRFPGGEGFTVKPSEAASFTLIWSESKLERPAFLSASELRALTPEEIAELKNLRTQSELRKPTIATVNGTTVVKALASSTVSVVKDIQVRWPQ